MKYEESHYRRFKSKLAPKGECLIFTGPLSSDNYGVFTVGNRTLRAHRFAYEMYHGEIPTGMLIRHSCHTPLCCAEAHLSPGSVQDNVNDCIKAGRHSRGDILPQTKLRESDVREIRKLIAKKISNAKIGLKFGVHKNTIRNIRVGRTFKGVGL